MHPLQRNACGSDTAKLFAENRHSRRMDHFRGAAATRRTEAKVGPRTAGALAALGVRPVQLRNRCKPRPS